MFKNAVSTLQKYSDYLLQRQTV